MRIGLQYPLERTNWPYLGRLERGKVRDCYVNDERRVIVVTDRISAFDCNVGTIPFKGQVLNSISGFWFEQTRDICPNHLISLPDPSVSVVHECEAFPIEMVVRGYLTGSSSTSIWTYYQRGEREYCGHALPEGLRKHEQLPKPLVTPTTKASHGEHDEPISASDAVARELVTQDEFDELAAICLRVFARGQELAARRGMILVDTKYELGRLPDGRIALIDEVHTPDSSRFWYADSYERSMRDQSDPKALDKEYVRRFLISQGFSGNGTPPSLPPEVRVEAARRYAEIFQLITGQPFQPDIAPATRAHTIPPRRPIKIVVAVRSIRQQRRSRWSTS